MHEFNITIKLENKDYCNGCPCLRGSKDFDSGVYCGRYRTEIIHHVQTFPEIKNTGYFHRLGYCKQNEVSNDK